MPSLRNAFVIALTPFICATLPQAEGGEAPESYEFFSWNTGRSLDGGEAFIWKKERKSGEYAAALRGTTPKSAAKAAFLSSIPVKPGDAVEFKAFVKSQGVPESGARIVLLFSDKDRKRLPEAAKNCGGSGEWRVATIETKAPEGAAFLKPQIQLLQSKGTCLFDDLTLKINGKEAEIQGGFEDALAPLSYEAWRLPVHADGKGVDGLVDITDMELGEHLLHYKGPDSLQGLTMRIDYNVVVPAQCHLTSTNGSQYWHAFNLATLGESFVYSNEKIDLSSPGRHQAEAPFTNRDRGFFDPLTKGPNCIRGHHYFHIVDKAGKIIGRTGYSDQISSPEASFFGKDKNTLGKSHRKCLYTIANLEDYSLEIDGFSSDWRPNGKFAFKVYVVDADKGRYAVNRADITVTASGKSGGRKLEVAQLFDTYDIPQGVFAGRFDSEVPEKLEIEVKTTAATPRGKEVKTVSKSFTKEEGAQTAACCEKKRPVEPKVEGRLAFISSTGNVAGNLSQDPAEGRRQVKDIVAKAKQADVNALCPFAMVNRCNADYDTNNKLFKRTFTQWDPLAEFRKATKDSGIQLHAAICVLTEGMDELNGILKGHPEYAARNFSGARIGWLDPAVPEVQDYRLDDIADIVRRYDPDGICLDYCRLSGGPSDRGAEIYMKETGGKDPRTFANGSKEYAEWFKWNGAKLTGLVKRIHDKAKEIKPSIIVGAYVQGVRRFGQESFRESHQDFPEWLRKGYLDAIYPTGYVFDMLRYRSWTARQIRICREANPDIPVMIAIGVDTGDAGALRSPQELVDQIDVLRELGGDGASFFTWHALDKWTGELRRDAYGKSAEFPKPGKR